MKRTAGVMLLAFMTAMLCLGILSRAVDAAATARIATSHISAQQIDHKVVARGTVNYKLEAAVFGEVGQAISVMYVQEGDWVEEGDALYVVDSKTLDSRIDEISARLQQIDLELISIGDVSDKSAQPSDHVGMREESLVLDRQTLKGEFDRLVSIREDKYTIFAGQKGIITSIMTDVGDVISGVAILLMAYPETELCVEATLSESEAEEVGEAITGNIDFGEGVLLENVTFTRAPEDEGIVKITAEIEEREVFAGQSCSIEFAISSMDYSVCIPVQAIHRDGTQCYVLVVESASGFLGDELIVRRTNVTVLDTSEDYAALNDGSLTSDQDILVRADKVVVDGDKVRVINA